MKGPHRLRRVEVLALHELMLVQYGGLAGVRDDDTLESALATPRNFSLMVNQRCLNWQTARTRLTMGRARWQTPRKDRAHDDTATGSR